MSAGDGNFTFTNTETHNTLSTPNYCKTADSQLIDNKGDSSETAKPMDNNFSERLANFMKNSKNLLENIDKKNNSVKFQHFENSGTNDTHSFNGPASPTHTLVELEETLMQLDDSKLKYIQRNDNKMSSEPLSKGKTSTDSNEKENVSELSISEKSVGEKQSKKYTNKNHNFQEALRIDELETELNKMKSHIQEKDKKINLLESGSSVPANIFKPTFRNIGTDFSTDPVEKKNSLYRGNILNQKPYEELVMNSSNKVMYNDDNTIEQNEYSSIKDYNPNNSLVLRNKIRDLESQIQDLQEANENAAQIMSSIKQKSLMETSNSTQSIISELIEKNNLLRDEVDRLHQSIPALKGDTISAQYLRQELENLKEDLSALKRQNSLIVMENIALKNQLKKKEMDSLLPKKHEDRNATFSQLNEYTQPNKSIRSDTYELNNHSKDLSDSDDSIYIPPSSILSNNQNKVMSMNNISTNLNISRIENVSNQPKKVCKLLPQGNRKKSDVYLAKKNIRHLSELSENGFTDSIVGDGKPIVLQGNEDCSSEKHYMDLSNDSTDSILSDANKEMQEMTYQSEVESRKSNFTIRSKYDKSLENGLQIEKTFHNREVLDNINDLEAIDNNKFSTLGRTAYAPRISYDVNIGDVVKFIRQGGRISKGLVHYVGPLPSRKDTYLGIELEVEDGKHDGIYDGKRYFQCIRNKGVFVAFNKIIMVYSRKN